MMRDLDIFFADRRMGVTAAIVVVVFSLYAFTANPTVSFTDSGELAAVAMTLGIAHPTGYPLFTILGRLVGMIIPGEPVAILNLFSSFLVACAVGLFYNIALEMTRSQLFPAKKKHAGNGGMAAVAGSLMFGFSTTVWAQSVAVEVYSLHLVLILLFLFLFLKGIGEYASNPPSRLFVLAFFVWGLAFTNHMTTLLVIPACMYLYVSVLGIRQDSGAVLVRMTPFFLLGLSVYMFLPVRSASYPPLDWGHPADFERFFWHVSGKQYASWIFSSFHSAKKQFEYFLTNYSEVFSWAAILLTVLGVWSLAARRRRLFWFIFLLVAGCLFYAINYDIHDIDSYFLLAYVGAGLFIVAGLQFVMEKLAALGNQIILAGILLLPVYEFLSHKKAVDESDNVLVRDYTMNILNELDSNAVVFTYQWDYFVSPSYYFQKVRNVRPDVAIIDKELLRRSWYFLQLETNFPWLVERSRPAIDAFLAELYKFEHDLPYQGPVIEERFNSAVNELVESALTDRPVFFGAEMEPQFAPGYVRVPDGLLLRLTRPGNADTLGDFDFSFKETGFRSRLTDGLRVQYAKMLTMRAIWLKNQGADVEIVEKWVLKALEIDPSFIIAQRILMELRE